MFLFELKRYFIRNNKRIMTVYFFILVASIYSLSNVKTLFLGEDYSLNLHNYIIGEFNSAQLMMFFIYPLLFSILLSDLILFDFDSGYISLISSRIKNRFQYILCKLLLILVLAVCFTLVVLICKVIIALILNIPFDGNLQIYIAIMLKKCSILEIYMYSIMFFIAGLTLVGMITLFISLYIKNSGISVGIIFLIGILHNIFLIMLSDYISLLPFSQYVIGLHNEFEPIGINKSYFTLEFSFFYIIFSILIMFLLVLKKIKKYNLGGN